MTQQDLLKLFYQAYNDSDSLAATKLQIAYPKECQELLAAINRTNSIEEFKELFDYNAK